MTIRPEEGHDHAAVRAVNEAAFDTFAEARLVDVLRARVRPIVSLVAEDEDAVAGHIMFSPVELPGRSDLKLMGLAPMAVAPERQRRGIGSALVRAGLEECRRLGVVAVVVLGHPDYYPRFSFAPASSFGIRSVYDAPDEAFMLVELVPGALRGASGTVKYHTAFDDL